MPILKEFGIWTSVDRERGYTLNRQTRCVMALFESYFQKFKTEKFWKILVECIPEITRPMPINELGVCTVQVVVDLQEFFQSPPQRKKELALTYLWSGIERVVPVFGWDLQPFQRARDAVIAAKYENRWLFVKPKLNRSRTYRASVECEHDIDAFRCFLVVETRKGTKVARTLIISEGPSEFGFVQHLGRLKWKTNEEVVFENREGKTLLTWKAV